MKAMGVIPARWGSTRFPGKSLAPVAGKPLIQWVLERARLAKRLSNVIVATDDERIRRAVERMGGQAVMTRPNHPSGTDRIAEAVAGQPVGVVVNIQGDEPLIDPGLIDRLVEVMEKDGSWDMATAAEPFTDTFTAGRLSVVKVVCDGTGRAMYFSRATIPVQRDEGSPPGPVTRLRHLGIYAYRREFLERLVKEPPCELEQLEKLEQLRALHIGARIAVLQAEGSGAGVDTPEDVPRVEALLRQGAARKQKTEVDR